MAGRRASPAVRNTSAGRSAREADRVPHARGHPHRPRRRGDPGARRPTAPSSRPDRTCTSWCQSWTCSPTDPPRSAADVRTTRNGSSATVRRFRDISCQNSAIASPPSPWLASNPCRTTSRPSPSTSTTSTAPARFYEAVFGWEFEPWGPPGFYLIHTGTADDPGIQGLMHAAQEPRTGTGLNGFEPTFSVADVDADRRGRRGSTVGGHLREGRDPDRRRADPLPRSPRATTSARCSTTRRRTPDAPPWLSAERSWSYARATRRRAGGTRPSFSTVPALPRRRPRGRWNYSPGTGGPAGSPCSCPDPPNAPTRTSSSKRRRTGPSPRPGTTGDPLRARPAKRSRRGRRRAGRARHRRAPRGW